METRHPVVGLFW